MGSQEMMEHRSPTAVLVSALQGARSRIAGEWGAEHVEVLAIDEALATWFEETARDFAARAHGSIDQRRKYTNEPYVCHPIAVADIVKSIPHSPEMIAAALLHDVVEDTPVTIEQIQKEFGDEVANLVDWLTDVSRPSDGNRAARKALDLAHIAKAPPAAKTIKLADLIDNTVSIRERDPDFWKVYRREKLRLLEVLKDGDAALWERAAEQCRVA